MESILAAFFIASLSLVGVLFFGRKGRISGTHRYIVPFAIGAFLAVVFLDLIPETIAIAPTMGPISIVLGFLLFYLFSNILHTYHHHHDEHAHHDTCSATKVSAVMLLWGDAIHNITDGVVIVSAFAVNPMLGIVTTLGIALHEIPQEIAEFGVLRTSGYSVKKALFLNFLSAQGVVVGVLLSLVFLSFLSSYVWILTGLAAGNLLFIATSDLLPGVHAESQKTGEFMRSFLVTLLGTVLIGALLSL